MAHRAAQRREREAAGDAWREHDLVFSRPRGCPIDPRDDFVEWKALLAHAGVRDARLHDGRHTSATLLLEQGVDVRVVMEILGHSELRVTQRYTHVASPLAEEAARRMGQALWVQAPRMTSDVGLWRRYAPTGRLLRVATEEEAARCLRGGARCARISSKNLLEPLAYHTLTDKGLKAVQVFRP